MSPAVQIVYDMIKLGLELYAKLSARYSEHDRP